MLVKEVITKNEALKELTDEQIAAIEALSKNDEAKVIGDKVREIHDAYDADIKAVTGIEKPADKKTYEHLKVVLGDYKKKAEDGAKGLQEQIEGLKKEKADLEKKIKEGKADEHLKSQVAALEKEKGDLGNRIAELQGQMEKSKAEWKEQLAKKDVDLKNKDIEFQFANDLAGMKFRDEKFIPKEVRETYIQSAKARILATTIPDTIDDGKGGQRLVFRDKSTEQILNNPENQLNPFTSGELLAKELGPILDKGRNQGGGGTGGGSGAPADLVLSLTNAGNQIKADELIQQHLMAKGLERGTAEFRDEHKKIREENEVSKLPMR